jgi:hypothetical protein
MKKYKEFLKQFALTVTGVNATTAHLRAITDVYSFEVLLIKVSSMWM